MKKVNILYILLTPLLFCSSGLLQPIDNSDLYIPENVNASQGVYENSIKVTWSNNEHIEHYIIYRSRNPQSDYKKIAEDIHSNEYHDKDIQKDSYFYKVKSVTADKIISNFSSFAQGYPKNVNFSVQATNGTNYQQIKISWNRPPDIDHFTIYRKNTREDKYKKIIDTYKNILYTDENIETERYLYKIIARNDKGKSIHTAFTSGYPKISAGDFLSFCNETIKGSQQKISIMGELGKETVYGDNTGICDYVAELDKSSFDVYATLSYQKYSDNDITLDGEQKTHITDLSDEIGTVRGKIMITGLYEGTIEYYLDIKEDSSTNGYYLVSHDGVTGKKFPHNHTNGR